MLKHKTKTVPASKRSSDRYIPCMNIDALSQLNLGSLWVKVEIDGEEKDVILYGASSNAWSGEEEETLFVVDQGQDVELPASTQILGFYEQRDLPASYANLWDDYKGRNPRANN